MEFPSGKHGFVPLYDFLKIQQNMGYEDMGMEEITSALLFNRAIAVDYYDYLQREADNGRPPPPVPAFRPFAAGSRIGYQPDTAIRSTNDIFTFLEVGYTMATPSYDTGKWWD